MSHPEPKIVLSKLKTNEIDVGSISTSTIVPKSSAGVSLNGTFTCTKFVCSDIQGIDVKQSARAATTGNITLSGEQTIDGIALISGDRCLVKDQTDQTQNGVWIVGTGSWTRAEDFNTTEDMQCARLGVCMGATHRDNIFFQTADTVIVGTDPITFTGLVGGGGGTDHNLLSNIQGGVAMERYHLEAPEHTELTQWLPNVTLVNDGSTTLPSLTLVNPITEFSTDGTLSGNSDAAVPTEKAVKTYVDTSNSVYWTRAATDLSPTTAGDNINVGTGGLKDNDITTAIPLGETSSTTLNSSFVAGSFLGAINENKESFVNMKEPTGFKDTTELNVTFSETGPDRTVTLTPTGSNFTVYANGGKFVKTTETFQISTATGVHVVYYNDSGVLTESVNPSESVRFATFRDYAVVCTVNWNDFGASGHKAVFFTGNNIMHGIQMDGTTNSYIYITQGLNWISGGTLSDFAEDGGGGLANHARFDVDTSVIMCQDNYITVPTIDKTVGLPVFYVVGGAFFRNFTSGYPVMTTGTGRLAYNPGATALAEVTDQYYAYYHIYVTTDTTYKVIAVMGIAQYATLALAQAQSTNEMTTINQANPLFELTPLGSVLYQTDDTYSNAVKSRVVSVSATSIYQDMRTTKLSRQIPALSHDQIVGLLDDDHSIYALLAGRSGDILKIERVQEVVNNAGVMIGGDGNADRQVLIKDEKIIMPAYAKVDKIELMGEGADVEIGTSGSNMRFKIPSSTEEYQWMVAGTQRLEFKLVDTNVMRIQNPNGLVEIENVIFNGSDMTQIGIIGGASSGLTRIQYQGQNSTMIILDTDKNIGIRNGDMHFSLPNAGTDVTFYEWRFGATTAMELKQISGLLVDKIGEQTSSAGTTFTHFIKAEAGFQDTNVTTSILLGDSGNTGLASQFTETTILGAINENREVFTNAQEPTGFLNDTDQVSTFTDGTRRFQIDDSGGGSFTVYTVGIKWVKTSAETVDLTPDTEGLWLVYYDNTGTLNAIANPTGPQVGGIVTTGVIVAWVYWDDTNNQSIYFTGDNEYHGIKMDGATHSYLHLTEGTKYFSGAALNTISADQDGSLAAHAQFGVDSGAIRDEDLTISLSAVVSTTGLPVYYKDGASANWRRQINAGFPIITTGSGRAAWNEYTGGAWQLTEVSNNDFVLAHVFATNDFTYPYIVILGEADYGTVSAARSGANTEINTLVGGSLPFAEFVPIATVIYQTSNTYSNAVKSRVRTTDLGANYVEWRFSEISPSSTPTSHSNLSGLLSDDHTQYALLAGRSGDTLIMDTINGQTTSTDIQIVGMDIHDDSVATSAWIFNIPTGNQYDFKINNVTKFQILESSIATDHIFGLDKERGAIAANSLTVEDFKTKETYLELGNIKDNNELKMKVHGEAYKSSGGSWITTSDERIKKNIKNSDKQLSLDYIRDISIKNFKYKDSYKPVKHKKEMIGIIAQELEKTFSKHFSSDLKYSPIKTIKQENGLKDFKQFDSSMLIFHLINCIQVLSDKIEKLKK